MTAARAREGWVDAVKGLACFLVAAGHGLQGLVCTGILDGGELWRWFNGAIYCFHVQLFFLCSGYLWQRFGRSEGWRGHGRAALQKAWILGVPYVAFTVLLWAIKKACAPWVNHPAGELWRDLFVSPVAPYWYLATLAMLFALLPRVRRKQAWAWMFGAATALKAVAAAMGGGGWCFAARSVAENAFWFSGGMGMAFRGPDWLRGNAAKRVGAAFGVLFLAGSAAAVRWGGFGNAWWKWGLGAAACAAVLAWAANRGENKAADFWNWTGRNALPIFLMHTFCAASVRMALCAVGMASPWAHVPTMLAASLFGSVALLRAMERVRVDGLLDPRRWRRGKGSCAGGGTV
jgi:fucose 4-O-acetylase-like acetyltransferase